MRRRASSLLIFHVLCNTLPTFCYGRERLHSLLSLSRVRVSLLRIHIDASTEACWGSQDSNRISMSSDKGKGRAHSDEAADQARADGPQDPSIISRVAASATSLARSALTSPNGKELSQSSAAALANSGKGHASSTGGGSAWAESSKTSQQIVPQPNLSNAFRPTQNEEHIRKSEDEFSSFLDGIDTFKPSQNLGSEHLGSLDSGFGQAWTRSQTSLNTKIGRAHV